MSLARPPLFVLFAATLAAATLPTGFTETQIAAGLANPTAMALAPDSRIFVCQQGGALRVIKNGSLLSMPFVTVNVNSSGERGLLGVAFDPNFAENQFVYLYYTVASAPIHNRVSRFTANGDVAMSGSETVLLNLNDLSAATNHNGGAIHFGPDGKLYVAVGDNANGANSQTLTNLLGKILRINADGSVPADNPFFAQASDANRAIWALGLRNPFTFSFEPGGTHMLINDVGQNTYEEINHGIAGANYGWPNSEGPTSIPGQTGPLHYYGHGATATTGCAITGGAYYKPATVEFPASYVGRYFFADFCNAWIRVFDPSDNSTTGFATGVAAALDLFTDDAGRLYYLARGTGAVMRIQYTSNQPPQITSHPQNKTVSVNQPVSFAVTASGAGTLTYQWQREGVDIPGATASIYSFNASSSGNGARFRCVVSNAGGSTNSNIATLTVLANLRPTGQIVTPVANTFYSAGTIIAFSGTGTDPEDGPLPASAFTWRVDFHHANHVHPHMPDTTGISAGSFAIPNMGETAVNVFYRIYLTVRDAGGLTHTSIVDLNPRVVTLTLWTNYSGLALTLDGQPMTSPFSSQSVVGMIRTIGAPTPQALGSRSYEFQGWFDRGAIVHNVITPPTNRTYFAKFRRSRGSGQAAVESPRRGNPTPREN